MNNRVSVARAVAVSTSRASKHHKERPFNVQKASASLRLISANLLRYRSRRPRSAGDRTEAADSSLAAFEHLPLSRISNLRQGSCPILFNKIKCLVNIWL